MGRSSDNRNFEDKILTYNYDEYCDLLGGSQWDNANQFLFQGIQEGKIALEVLWLKWNLFASLCQKVLVFHKKYQRPHLHLHPACVEVVTPSLFHDFLPARWIFTVQISEEGASLYQNSDIPSDLDGRLYQFPADMPPVYLSPVLRDDNLGHEITATVLVRALEKIRDPQNEWVRGIIETQIISDQIQVSNCSENDIFQITLQFPDEKTRPFRIWSRKTVSPEKGLLMKGVTDPLPLSTWKYLEQNRQTVFNQSRLAIYRTYHIPSDLYSLGMILMRTLLVNDSQDIAKVNQMIKRISKSFEPMIYGLPGDDMKSASTRLRNLLKEEGNLFPKESVLTQREQRESGWVSIPDGIWYDALVIAFKCFTWIPGFSFCQNHGDYIIGNVHQPLERAMTWIDRLTYGMKLELFNSSRRNREVLQACDRVRQELIAGRNR